MVAEQRVSNISSSLVPMVRKFVLNSPLSLRTRFRLWEILAVPDPGRTVACVWWVPDSAVFWALQLGS